MPHLIEEALKQNPQLNIQQAVQQSLKRIEVLRFAIISTREPDKIICARNESPLVLGINHKGVFCASDIPAFLEVTNKAVMINNGELVILTNQDYEIKKISDGSTITREPISIEWTAEMAVKQGHPHFMIKEIHEQPETYAILCVCKTTILIYSQHFEIALKVFWLHAEQATTLALQHPTCSQSLRSCRLILFTHRIFLNNTGNPSTSIAQISCRKPIRRNRGYISGS